MHHLQAGLYWLCRFWATLLVRLGLHFFDMKVTGKEHIAEAQTVRPIIVFNHVSYLDGIILASILAPTGIAKASVANLTFFGVATRALQFLFIKRRGTTDEQNKHIFSGKPAEKIAERAVDSRQGGCACPCCLHLACTAVCLLHLSTSVALPHLQTRYRSSDAVCMSCSQSSMHGQSFIVATLYICFSCKHTVYRLHGVICMMKGSAVKLSTSLPFATSTTLCPCAQLMSSFMNQCWYYHVGIPCSSWHLKAPPSISTAS